MGGWEGEWEGERNQKDKRNKEKNNGNKARGQRQVWREREVVCSGGAVVGRAGGRQGGRADTVFEKKTNNLG